MTFHVGAPWVIRMLLVCCLYVSLLVCACAIVVGPSIWSLIGCLVWFLVGGREMSAEKFLVKSGLAVDVTGVVSKIVEWCDLDLS